MRKELFLKIILISVLMGFVFPLMPFEACPMPPNPLLLERLKKGDADIKLAISPEELSDWPEGLNAPTPKELAPQALGTGKFVVLLIQYSGQTGGKTATEFDNLLFSSGTYPTGSMNDYYREISYGQFGVTGDTYPTSNPWYSASGNESYYTNGSFGVNDTYPQNAQGLVREAVIAADSTVNFANYDTDADGYVDAVFVIFPGYGAESTGNSGDIMAHKWALSGGNNGPGAYLTNDGVYVDLYTVESELRGISGQYYQ